MDMRTQSPPQHDLYATDHCAPQASASNSARSTDKPTTNNHRTNVPRAVGVEFGKGLVDVDLLVEVAPEGQRKRMTHTRKTTKRTVKFWNSRHR